jgi:fatty-acyl-CoA synthase
MEAPSSKTVGKLLTEISAKYPTHTAIVHDRGELTYQALNTEVDRAARSLLALGLRRGDPVAALMGNQPEWMIVCFAVARIGAIFVPLSTWYRSTELAWSLRHTGAASLVCVDSFLGHNFAADLNVLIPELATAKPGNLHAESYPALRSVTVLGAPSPGAYSWEEFIEIGRSTTPESLRAAVEAVTPEDLMFILYTSGSTAEPKGVTLRHRGVVENSFGIGERRGITSSDRVWLGSPLFYALGAVNAMPATVTHGATLVLQGHFTAARAIETIQRVRATIFYGTSNMIRAIVEDPTYSKVKLQSLRGGAAGISTAERRILIEDIGAIEATPSYGLTETYGNATGGFTNDSMLLKLSTAGTALPGFELRIADPETRRALPVGQTGLLLIRGYVTDSYFKNPEETERVIDSDGWFDTGDLGSIRADGYFRFEARVKEVIKVGGINVSPLEVEQLLLKYPAIQQAYVVGIPDALRGEVVVAVVVSYTGFEETKLREHLRGTAAGYKMPRHFLLRTDAEIPRLASGKVARIKLRAEAIDEIDRLSKDRSKGP